MNARHIIVVVFICDRFLSRRLYRPVSFSRVLVRIITAIAKIRFARKAVVKPGKR